MVRTSMLSRRCAFAGVVRSSVALPANGRRKVLASWIPEFLAHYPAIEIELHLNDRMVGIAFERIDIALRITFTASPDLVAIPDRMQLLRNRTLLAFLREHLAAAV